jgi:DNA-binding NtrC family response regulator
MSGKLHRNLNCRKTGQNFWDGILGETKGNKSEAARRLGIDYKTLFRKIKTYQLKNEGNSRVVE